MCGILLDSREYIALLDMKIRHYYMYELFQSDGIF